MWTSQLIEHIGKLARAAQRERIKIYVGIIFKAQVGDYPFHVSIVEPILNDTEFIDVCIHYYSSNDDPSTCQERWIQCPQMILDLPWDDIECVAKLHAVQPGVIK